MTKNLREKPCTTQVIQKKHPSHALFSVLLTKYSFFPIIVIYENINLHILDTHNKKGKYHD
jgi:hypothetical protein